MSKIVLSSPMDIEGMCAANGTSVEEVAQVAGLQPHELREFAAGRYPLSALDRLALLHAFDAACGFKDGIGPVFQETKEVFQKLCEEVDEELWGWVGGNKS